VSFLTRRAGQQISLKIKKSSLSLLHHHLRAHFGARAMISTDLILSYFSKIAVLLLFI